MPPVPPPTNYVTFPDVCVLWLVKLKLNPCLLYTSRLGWFLPYAVPGVVAAIIWLCIYTPEVSPLNSLVEAFGGELTINFFGKKMILLSMANMTTWTFTGYNMLIFLAALQAIPHDLYEAARLDGASGFQIVTKIKIPMVRGAALLAILLSIVGTIQLYNEPAVMETSQKWMGPAYTPMMMALNTAKGYMSPSGDGSASAIAIVMALIAGILAVAYFLSLIHIFSTGELGLILGKLLLLP